MSLGALIVEIEARTGKFETDTGRAAKIMEKRAKEINAHAEKMGKAIGTALGVGIAGAVVGLTALTKKAIDAADQFNKLSQSTGLSVESLSALDYAAKLSGVEDLAGSLTKLNNAIVSASQGSKGQVAAFEAIGVAVTDAQGKIRPTEDVLRDIANAFARYEDGAAKTALAMDLFGKSGAGMIPLLNGGSAAIDRATKRAKELGIVISQDTATAAEAFNDALSDVGFAMDGVGRSIAASLAPRLKGLADIVADPKFAAGLQRIIEAAVSGTEAIARLISKMGEAGGSRELQKLQREADFLQQTIEKRTKGKGFLEVFGRDVDGEIAQMQSRLAAIQLQMEDITNSQFDAALLAEAEALERVGQKASEAAPGVLNYAGAADRADRASKKAKKSVDEWATSLESAIAIREEAERLFGELDAQAAAVADSVMSPDEQLSKRIAELERLSSLGKITEQQFGRARIQAEEAFISATSGYEKVGEAAKTSYLTMEQFADAAAENMQDALAGFFMNFDQGLKGMVRSFAQAMQQLAAQQLALKTFDFFTTTGSGGFKDILLGIGGGLGGGGGGSGWMSTFASFFGGGPKALGGPVSAGTPYLVGERGPELMVPKTAGSIVPNRMLGGGGVNLRVVNAFDQGVMADYMSSAAGEEVFMNLVNRNGAKIRNLVAGGV